MNKREREQEKQKQHVKAQLLMIRGDMSQEKFALKIGKTQAQVCQWEKGKCMPSMPTILQICKRTKTDASVFIPALKKPRRAS